MAGKLKITEAQVQEHCVQLLEADGWRAFKMEAVSDTGFVGRAMQKIRKHPALSVVADLVHAVLRSCMRAAGVGEPGMPDYLFVRYQLGKGDALELPFPFNQGLAAEVLWIEFKAPGKEPQAHQIAWAAAEKARGALHRFVDDVDAFDQWYIKDSGLCRKFAK